MMVKPVTEGGLLSRVQEVIFRPRPFIFGPTYYGPCRRRRVDRGRNHEYFLDGTKCDGVTTLLNGGVPKPARSVSDR